MLLFSQYDFCIQIVHLAVSSLVHQLHPTERKYKPKAIPWAKPETIAQKYYNFSKFSEDI